MDAERDEREARKKMYFERYSLVALRILMYGEVNKMILGTTFFLNWCHILSQNN